ncbi:MAG: methyltransferase [Albidovulum sp.]|nr:methyltransferase [Albidovulum sp.]MDE0531945.1 methyltransferase [Albidovulum sp.]
MELNRADLTRDSFLGKAVQVLQPKKGYRAGIDSVLLAAAAPARSGQSVLELGCGSGVVCICLARRVGGLTFAGLELQEAYADLARKNSRINAFEFEVLEGDVSDPPKEIRARQFDHVLANPPYFRRGSGSGSSDTGRERSNMESTPLTDWINCAVKRLKPSGCFTMINRAERLDEILVSFEGRGCSLEVKPVYSRANAPCIRVIIRARKNRRDDFRLAAPLVLFSDPSKPGDSPKYSARVDRLLRTPIPLEF